MKITDLIAALERIKTDHGNLTVAEEMPRDFMGSPQETEFLMR